jgi:hypothetical protein
MTPSLERELLARLDLAAASHCGPSDPPLSGWQGRSQAALVASCCGYRTGDLTTAEHRARLCARRRRYNLGRRARRAEMGNES